ncbi:nicotinate-nucleotide pyrophosphorylase [carboxylating] [Sulfuritortus calidifontis]|uniref:Probable nicotinate-nucleotide pyrophosphorylase [carboxylating] n=1 Tax=Sulfuritortus calidifontis TaxID=1914471 RepID=A0A4R3JPT8_9PROT|nr:carboxylating nicotinate-nucleotide diphosphorylase [Sulfuritortus calidifontis]TCS68788.1 nicotinate-nucleotide pyrophosphorylase [carboxylating] [Sulfuritortus calidifontis]
MDLSQSIAANVRAALDEDLGGPDFSNIRGDLTAQLIPADKTARARIITREDAVLAGQAWFEACFRALDPQAQIVWQAKDGDRVAAGQTLCEVSGQARALLSAERSALNFLQTLSGVATVTRRYVEAVAGTKARIYDTRKTLPGLRQALKYAVRCGGGVNHRVGLYDGILIKENHIAATGGIRPALERAFVLAPEGVFVQIEVETLSQLEEALACGVKLVLLDNFDLAGMREAVRLTAGRAQLEASGGVDLATVRAIAETGVDRISIGSLTKHLRAVDLSMRLLD